MQPRYMTKAAKEIKKSSQLANDVASEMGQMLDNVAHTMLFVTAVAQRIKDDEKAPHDIRFEKDDGPCKDCKPNFSCLEHWGTHGN